MKTESNLQELYFNIRQEIGELRQLCAYCLELHESMMRIFTQGDQFETALRPVPAQSHQSAPSIAFYDPCYSPSRLP